MPRPRTIAESGDDRRRHVVHADPAEQKAAGSHRNLPATGAQSPQDELESPLFVMSPWTAASRRIVASRTPARRCASSPQRRRFVLRHGIGLPVRTDRLEGAVDIRPGDRHDPHPGGQCGQRRTRVLAIPVGNVNHGVGPERRELVPRRCLREPVDVQVRDGRKVGRFAAPAMNDEHVVAARTQGAETTARPMNRVPPRTMTRTAQPWREADHRSMPASTAYPSIVSSS